jgi:hypothetical protein
MARSRYVKNAKLKKTLDTYARDITAMTNIKPKQFEGGAIANMIASLPERKWNAAQAIVDFTDESKQLKQYIKGIRATKMMEASSDAHKARLSNAEDRKAYVENDEEVQKAEIDLINAEAQLVAARLAYECLDDLFTAGKKIMDTIVKQDLAERQYDRFKQDGSNRH